MIPCERRVEHLAGVVERRPERASRLNDTTLVLMGWACVIRVDLLLKLPGACFWYLLAGGIVYTVGMIFYRIKKIPLNHAIWHIFVLGGSILHFVSVFCYLLA